MQRWNTILIFFRAVAVYLKLVCPILWKKPSLVTEIRIAQKGLTLVSKTFLFFASILTFQPHDHQKKVAKFYYATPELVNKAIETSMEAKKEWERVPLQDRMDLFLKVADQCANEYRADLNATTMLGQAKTIIQVCTEIILN